MEEEKYVENLRKTFDSYKARTIIELADLKMEKQRLGYKLAFFVFEYNLIRGTLPQNIKTAYDQKNVLNTRLNDIMSLKDERLSYANLPVEIKMVIEEMIL